MRLSLLLYLLLYSFLSLSQEFLPTSKGQIVRHSFYTLSYIEEYEQAEWVHYKLTPEMFAGTYSRTNDFRPDPNIKTGSAQLSDYKYSGYDRGHLAPAGDMKISLQSMSESFFMSNMSPQSPMFNRGIWKNLELTIRNWASKEVLYIITGGVLKEGLKEIGLNGVDVPQLFYKVVYSPEREKMIAFLLPNEKSIKSVKDYAVSVDIVEDATGIDFFPQMDYYKQSSLEGKFSNSDWSYEKKVSIRSSYNSSSTIASQCKGVANSSSKRCKNKTKNLNGYCYLHQSQVVGNKKTKESNSIGRCNAITNEGNRCRRNSTEGSKYCWQHK